ncbi:MAG: L-threonylcarbamoyladenylate synthase [Bacteroidetes bacterium]|nr:L-threonylcarbamoyladenylate synthase [Bacteroidota bacterium]
MYITKNAELINIDADFDKAVQKAKKNYLEGSVFIYPTDTIYGFGANPFNSEAVKRIDEIKHREPGKMYILLINSIEVLLKYIEIKSEKHLDFLLSIWPNPVSVVLTLNSKTSEILGTETAAFRIPNHRFCVKLTSELQMPIISTSVNRSSQPPLLDPSVIVDEFSSELDAIFYSEKKCYYEASTLIDLSDSVPILIREGKIKFDDILEKFQKS